MLRRDHRAFRPQPAAVFGLLMLMSAGCVPAIPPVPPVPDAPAGALASDASPLESALGAATDTMDQAIELDLAANRLLPEPRYDCSDDAATSGSIAEELLAAGQRTDARSRFAEALAICPGNARWWIDAGDVELRDGNLDAAKQMLTRGLAIEPWERDGHRYLSYVETGLGNDEESWRQSVLAVVSDPTCETCWAALRKATDSRGGTFLRQYERKPVARAVYGHLDLELDPVKEIANSRGWIAYAIGLGTRELRRADLSERPSAAAARPQKTLHKEKIDDEWAKWSPLERERYLVRTTLASYRPEADRPPAAPSASSGRTPKTWPTIRNAVDEGYLDEAIFMQLLDAALVPQFVAYRRAHADRLFDHVTNFLAVLPSGVGKRRSSQNARAATVEPQRLALR
ncbi:MAG TPA: tetratricopeptide repeat protein [Candidatus Limnocylindrales bacterium]|nr:tetratricopeptide repeat protein [Candidatus Limnocylindrales bacterium]